MMLRASGCKYLAYWRRKCLALAAGCGHLGNDLLNELFFFGLTDGYAIFAQFLSDLFAQVFAFFRGEKQCQSGAGDCSAEKCI